MEMMIASAWVRGLITAIFVVVCLLLILVVLLQKGRGGGLSGAFGGTGGHSAFGAKTGDVFTWVTIGLTIGFVGIAVVGNWAYVPDQPADLDAAVTAPPGQAADDAGGNATGGEGAQPVESAAPSTQPGQ